MTFEDIVTEKVREAVHQALDERDENALPELYTLRQAEEHYGGHVKAATLRALCKSGVLPYVRLTPEGAYYLTPDGLRAAIERCTHQPVPQRPRIPRKARTR